MKYIYTQIINEYFVYRFFSFIFACLFALLVFSSPVSAQAPPPNNPQSGAIGMQGSITSPPPTQGATITVPTSGQTFSQQPITVSGICPDGLLVKLFKNNVFAGSVQCQNGSYSIQTDLFNGQNELIARVFDELDQAGPDSNIVVVTFEDNRGGAISRPTLSSNFAKRGANPGSNLSWPIILSGGEGPYAISVDWGDGSAPDLFSREFPGTFDINHVYDRPGVYNIVVKATDGNDNPAFLQLVGVANGPLSQTDGGSAEDESETTSTIRVLWQPAALLIPFIISTFWLGKKYELRSLRNKIERGERPF
ncbi:hypothetical protein BH23PAT2_BH23PAT2_01000 [soil metagenome]